MEALPPFGPEGIVYEPVHHGGCHEDRAVVTPLEVVLLGLLQERYARAHVEKAAHPGDHSMQNFFLLEVFDKLSLGFLGRGLAGERARPFEVQRV